MKNIRFFLSDNFMFLEVKNSIYLQRRVFVMYFMITLLVKRKLVNLRLFFFLV